MAVLARAFCTEPVCSAVAELDPRLKARYHDWVEFIDFWMDHCAANGPSVYALDEQTHRIAGVFIVRDLLWNPAGFEAVFRDDHSKALTPWMHFLWYLDEQAGRRLLALGEASKAGKLGDFVDLWFLGVHPDFRGHKVDPGNTVQ